MRKYFEISGYWKDTKEVFEGYIVTNFDDYDENGDLIEDETGKFTDDDIFFYGMEEHEIQQAIVLKENTVQEFVITDYKII